MLQARARLGHLKNFLAVYSADNIFYVYAAILLPPASTLVIVQEMIGKRHVGDNCPPSCGYKLKIKPIGTAQKQTCRLKSIDAKGLLTLTF